MFAQNFSVYVSIDTNTTENIMVENKFFNAKNELCAIVMTKLYWVDFSKRHIIDFPQQMQFLVSSFEGDVLSISTPRFLSGVEGLDDHFVEVRCP